MSRLTAPLLSFGASGQIGKTLVFADWKGRKYARSYVVPANPKTTAQVAVRDVFRWLNSTWRYMPAASIGAWTLYGTNSQFTDRNGWLKINQPALNGDTDLTDMVVSPAAGGGLPDGGMVVTPGDDQMQVVLTAPTLPTGWTITQAHAVVVENVDPSSTAIPDVAGATDASSPYDMTITGLLNATEYLVAGWFEYTKPNGSSAFGVNSTALATTL